MSRRRSSFRERYRDPTGIEGSWYDLRAGEAVGDRLGESSVYSKHIRFTAAQRKG